ncbi:radical SAM/SPASM domain-containing protein [Streptomyces sp. NBC_01136]|uniref:radical SAM protein n=1 Tax=Streptomyces sp. NBC_01136 TaxID=2903754 RepID=UPI00386EB684|nr:radical SAM/SPASM domain-containing protein [Streptomyces sp. NBC_01136]
MTTIAQPPIAATTPVALRMLWLDMTRLCQLACTHCYNDSGPQGDHGSMTGDDWTSVLGQAVRLGVQQIQLTGGEVTMYPGALALVDRAQTLGLKVEVYSNLVHVTNEWWEALQRDGITLATSYYSDHATEHNAMTGRPSHARTRSNIVQAVNLGIPLRAGVIVGSDEQRAGEARRELEDLGVSNVRMDDVRPFGRGAQGQAPDVAKLCGRCGTDRAAIGPNGEVSPCVFSAWLNVGNVKDTPLADILGGAAMGAANASIRKCHGGSSGTAAACTPDTDDECSPGTPGSECTPKN